MIETSCGLGNDCVFKSSGSRRNILAQDVFDKMQQREIGQKYRPDLLLDLHHRMEIPKSVTDFLLVEIEERCTRDVFTYAFESVCIVNKKKGAKSLKWTESGIPRKYVLSLKQIFAAKAELMEIARHEQQNGHLLSSKDLQDNGIQEDMIIWALMRHKNLGSSLVVCCHLQSIKTSVRTSLKGNSYLVEIAQGGAKWGVSFETMLAEQDAAILTAAIR
ncbi:hypothetical protein ACFX10_039590 [Malus domestica]